MQSYPDEYVRAAGLRYGVPIMWLDDYVQDVRLQAWLYPNMLETVVMRTVGRNFQRWLNRQKNPTKHTVELTEINEPVGHDFTSASVRRLDFVEQFNRLTPAQRTVLAKYALGIGSTATERRRRHYARTKLKEFCA